MEDCDWCGVQGLDCGGSGLSSIDCDERDLT